MSNKFILTIFTGVLIISLTGFFLAISVSNNLKISLERIEKTMENLDRKEALLDKRVAPYIYTGESVGYVIGFENGTRFYFSGPTGLDSNLQLIGRFYKPDVAFLPIGNIYSLSPKSAAYAACLIDPSSYIVPDRYASFPELVKNPEEFFKELEKYDLRSKALKFQIGEEKELLGIKTEWLGHGAWLLESPKGLRILIDPEVQYNLNFPRKYRELVQLKKIDLILFTNGRFDSLSLSDFRKWGQLFNPVFITPYELGIWLKSRFPSYKIVAVDQGASLSEKELLKLGVSKEKAKKFSDLIIDVVSASHSSSAIPE
ncbi:MBL fold metallo-hydrolase [bacterium]|nr:MBL fold metallo-hydrolase [bacterium]